MRDATGLRLVLAGFGVFVVTLVLTAMTPEGARVATYLGGVALGGGACVVGGLRGRRALTEDTPHPVRAAAAAMAGLVTGITAGIYVAWNLIALFA